MMRGYELSHPELYHPFAECLGRCEVCDRRTRNQAESYVREVLTNPAARPLQDPVLAERVSFCGLYLLGTAREAERIRARYGTVDERFGYCVYVHLMHLAEREMAACAKRGGSCACTPEDRERYLRSYDEKGRADS